MTGTPLVSALGRPQELPPGRMLVTSVVLRHALFELWVRQRRDEAMANGLSEARAFPVFSTSFCLMIAGA